MKILVIGGTGFAGAFIAKEACKKGHSVCVLSRSKPQEPIDGITYVQGSAADNELLKTLLSDVDVVVTSTSPRGDMTGKVLPMYMDIARLASENNVRFVIVGGFSSLRPTAEAKRFFESGDVPAEYLAEATELATVFDTLKSRASSSLRWVFISPAAVFGAHAAVPDFGTYRLSGDVALFDEKGESIISGADFALGVIDEIEKNKHDKENISFVH